MNELLFKTGILIFFSVLRLLIALPLLAVARRNRLTNLYWLLGQFAALVIAVPFADVGLLRNAWIFWTFISLSEIALIMFVHTTFARGRRSPMPVLMTLAVLGLVGGIAGNLMGNFEFSAWAVYPNAVLIWGWHLWEAHVAYKSISSDRFTDDWVKARYRLMIAYSGFDFFAAILGTASTTGLWVYAPGSIIIVLMNFASVTVQLFAWVMPGWLRNWLNRNYRFPAEAQHAEELHL